MTRKVVWRITLRFVMISLLLCFSAHAQQLQGLWGGTVLVDGVLIPFQIELTQQGAEVSGAYLNGDQRVTSTQGRIQNGILALSFDHYAEKLQASVQDTALDGTIEGRFGPGPRSVLRFKAERVDPPSLPRSGNPYVDYLQIVSLWHRSDVAPAAEEKVPLVDGVWEIPVQSPKGESSWRFIVKQTGVELSAAILRIDGDTGALTGKYESGKFVLSHFAGERPYLLEATPSKDGTLRIILHDHSGWRELTAYRPAAARAKGLPEPDDPSQHTEIRNRSEVLHFSFPDLEGRKIKNTDARFRNKVVLVNIMGSWCPNCHDEAPFLAGLYRRYRAAGLEIVGLDFEESEQGKELSRLRAFIEHYGIEYPVLVAGEPGQLTDKIPQAVNLNAWPTTIFIGRDGLVRNIHAGFAGPASGEFHRRAEVDIEAQVKSLLAESSEASR